ncbi:MAG: ATP-binding protein [Planctomycetota bacterium]
MNEIFRYRKLQQFGTLILKQNRAEGLQKTLFELLPEVLDIDVAALFLRSAGNRWFLKAASENGNQLKPVLPRLREYVKKREEGLLEPEEETSPILIERRLKNSSKGFPLIAAFPLLIMGTIKAFIVTARQKQRIFSTDDLNRLEHVAALVSTAMENQFVVSKLRQQADHLAEEKASLKTKVAERTRELTREKEFASLLRERAPYMVFVLNRKGMILFANPFSLEVIGCSAQELTGKNFFDLLSHEDGQTRTNRFPRLFRTVHSETFQTTINASEGCQREIIWNAIKRTNEKGRPAELICIGRDVTRRAHLEAHNRVLLETLPDGMFRVNECFEIVEINKHASDLLGVEPQSLIGKKCYDTICTETKETCPIFSKGRDAISYETSLSSSLGESFPVLKSIRRYNLGSKSFTIETFKDIAHFKRMESKLLDYAENLERMVDQRTEELRKAQLYIVKFERLVAAGQLAASIAHEINNPIYGIRGCLQSVLEETELSQDLRHYVELSIQETDRISELIKGMQNFHKSSESSRRLEDVTAVLGDILVLYKKFLKDKKIDLHLNLEPRLPAVSICVDEIKQVFINLITNAAESMPKGGELTIKTLKKEDSVEVHFKDTGCGMTRDVRERIFDAFFTTKAAVKGVGLGLPVCWGIVQGHGGRLQVETTPDKGSTFILALPVAKENDFSKETQNSNGKEASQSV